MRGARMLARGRERAVERMDSVCVITRPGAKTWDEETGAYEHPTVTVYEGVCRLVSGSASGRKVTAGGQLLVVTSPEVHLPADTVGVEVSDTVLVTACVSRPSAVGEVFTIREPVEGTQVTALRFRVEAGHGR